MGNTRKFVLKLLLRLEQDGSYSNILLDKKLAASDLSEQDKRFASALFYGVIERRLTLDAVIDHYCTNKSQKLGNEVRNILRLGVYQLKFMDSVPDSAAVDESVKLAKRTRNPASAGFVNAVLRSFIRDEKALPTVKGRIKQLSLEYSCPEWLVRKWTEDYGDSACERILACAIGKAPEYVRLNTVKLSEDEIISSLEEQGVSVTKTAVAGCVRLSFGGSVEELDAFKNGLIHVQDLSCQLCCKALEPQRGDTVLDLCAAPGGKTFTIAELMSDEGSVYAFDLHDNRVRLISEGAGRLGLSCVRASVNNAKVFDPEMPKADRILCDVPCSGLGVIRRKPEIKYKPADELERLPGIQLDILKTSSQYLKPGGVLVYSTCSLSVAENEDVIEKFLEDNKDFAPEPLGKAFGARSEDTHITVLPDDYDSDGFFIAKFRRLR